MSEKTGSPPAGEDTGEEGAKGQVPRSGREGGKGRCWGGVTSEGSVILFRGSRPVTYTPNPSLQLLAQKLSHCEKHWEASHREPDGLLYLFVCF